MRLIARLLLPAALAVIAAPDASASDWQWAFGGNMQYDWLRTDENDRLSQLSDVRRTRFSLNAKAPAGFDAKVEYDVHANIWTDVWVRWRGEGHGVRVGQYKQPMFLDELTSDRYTLFMEQGLPSSFALARRIGAEYSYATPHWRFSLSAYDGNLRGLQKGAGGVGRAVWTPWAQPGDLLHLALSAGSESPDGDIARFSSRVEQSGIGRTRLDTGVLTGVDRIRRTGLEALWIRGPFTAQGEYLRADLSRRNAGDAALGGWYAQLGWFVSGDHSSYKDGALEIPDLGEDGRAVEIAARISALDLDDGSVRGGDTRNYTLGANWYLGKHVRLAANYVHVDGERRGADVQPDVLEARVMLTF